MAAPRTSTRRIAADNVLTVTPAFSNPCTEASATTMAPSAPSSGSSHSSGLRYTKMRMITTISTAVSSSRFSVLLLTPPSVVSPADPVTATCRPPRPSPSTARRMSCTAVESVLNSLLPPLGDVTLAVNSSAFPSADRCGRPGAPSPRTWVARRPTAARAEATAARPVGVRPALRTNTTVAWSTSGWPGPCCSSTTLVDGADDGRLAAAVPLARLDRVCAAGYRATTPTSQTITTGQRSSRRILANRPALAGPLRRRSATCGSDI